MLNNNNISSPLHYGSYQSLLPRNKETDNNETPLKSGYYSHHHHQQHNGPRENNSNRSQYHFHRSHPHLNRDDVGGMSLGLNSINNNTRSSVSINSSVSTSTSASATNNNCFMNTVVPYNGRGDLNNNKHTVHWFRRGLRLHDNPSLREGIQNSTTFRCVFVLDPWFAGSSNNVGINKWRFLLHCLQDLDRSLRKLNSRLFVVRGQPCYILPKLFKEWGITTLSFEEDPEPFGRVRDQNIIAQCKELNIDVIVRTSHTLYHLDLIIDKNGGKAPLTYRQFQNIVATLDPPPPPEPAVTVEFVRGSYTPVGRDHDEKFGVPTLEELGFETDKLKPPVWKGGETEVLSRLQRHLERKAWVACFGRPKMTPQSLLSSQTGVSPYLRFGCLSTRLFYYKLSELFRKIRKTEPPLSLYGQILWREFFYCAASRNPNFDKMMGNPVCLQIPWTKDAVALTKWANAQTGFPWIDAVMTQLREEGWIHHLARHAVACFLTRGDLWISWEEGMKVFEELLLDADWSVNAGTWMWLSCSSFFQQFFHCYCPIKFGRKADPLGEYIRRYLPVLKNMPNQYIHEPWVAPIEVQKQAKCIIGKNYPLPMVNHEVASKINAERLKQVYQSLSKFRGSMYTSSNTPNPVTTHQIQIEEQEQNQNQLVGPNSTFTSVMEDSNSMVNTTGEPDSFNGKSLHELMESAISDTLGAVGIQH